MAGGDNAESNYGFFSEKRMEEEEGGVNVRTVDCLRGRLLAERMASKNANEEADKLGNKMKELEKLLEQEAKSRKRAEKRLKSVMKKLESLNITYYNASSLSSSGDESCLVDNKSEVSYVSSLASSNPTTQEHHHPHPQENDRFGKDLVACKETEMGTKEEEDSNSPSIKSGEFEQRVIADEGFLSFEKSTQVGSAQSCSESKMDEHSHSDNSRDTNIRPMRQEEEINQEEDGVDNSMALVPIDVQQEVRRIDPQVLDNTVKEVLDALKYAKEQLQSSMEKRRRRGSMIRVG